MNGLHTPSSRVSLAKTLSNFNTMSVEQLCIVCNLAVRNTRFSQCTRCQQQRHAHCECCPPTSQIALSQLEITPATSTPHISQLVLSPQTSATPQIALSQLEITSATSTPRISQLALSSQTNTDTPLQQRHQAVTSQQQTPRRRIPGTNVRIRTATDTLTHANDEDETSTQQQAGDLYFSSDSSDDDHDIITTTTTLDENIMTQAEMIAFITQTRPRTLQRIPTEAQTIWVNTLDRIAELTMATDTRDTDKDLLTLLFIAAPMFILNKDEVTYDDIHQHLCQHYSDIKYYIRKRTTSENTTPQQQHDSTDIARILVENGNCKKAWQRLSQQQHDTSQTDSATVLEQLKRKVIHAGTDLSTTNIPDKVKSLRTLFTAKSLRRAIAKLANAKAPSTGMMKAEHLKPLTHITAKHAWQLVTATVSSILDGTMPPIIQQILYVDAMIAIPKDDKSHRPIAMANVFIKIAAKLILPRLSTQLIVGDSQHGYKMRNGTQLAAKKIQAHLDAGRAVIKTDVSNAFGSVNRQMLASMMFDNHATKPLWAYFASRYLTTSTYMAFHKAQHIGEVTTDTGIGQGDPFSLLMFDFFVSDADKRIQSCEDIIQIHDDMYVAVNTHDIDEAMHQTMSYFHRKHLPINVSKTKILVKDTTTIPQHLRKLIVTDHVLIGGGYVHAHHEPLSEAVLQLHRCATHLCKLPHQHAMTVLRSTLIPAWKYVMSSTHPEIVHPLIDSCINEQLKLVSHILATTQDVLRTESKEQLFTRTSHGGLGLYRPSSDTWHNLELPKAAKEPRCFRFNLEKCVKNEWFSQLPLSSQRALFMPYANAIDLRPEMQHLRLDNESYAAYVSYLLLSWQPKKFFCRMEAAMVNPQSHEEMIDHVMTCSSCTGPNKTLRHDIIGDAWKDACKHSGVRYAHEPKHWPLRTKPSNSGKDGPDGVLYFGRQLMWLDFSIVHQKRNESRSNMQVAYTYKLRTYSDAREKKHDVRPVIFSATGAQHESTLAVLNRVRKEHGKIAVRNIANAVLAATVRSIGYFKQNIDVKHTLESLTPILNS